MLLVFTLVMAAASLFTLVLAALVPVWDLEKKDEAYKTQNSNTATSDYSERSGTSNGSSNEGGSVSTSARAAQFDIFQPGVFMGSQSIGSPGASRHMSLGTSHHGTRNRVKPIHVLSISAAVTRLSWRPPAFPFSRQDTDLASEDPHDGMLAIASAPVKGRAGGNGLLSLWSHHRPFMPLSVCEGHSEGAVTDFVWLDTPREIARKRQTFERMLSKRTSSGDHSSRHYDGSQRSESRGRASTRTGPSSVRGSSAQKRMQFSADSYDGYIDIDTDEDYGQADERLAGDVWQHVLSVGRDGRCLLQSFARGR